MKIAHLNIRSVFTGFNNFAVLVREQQFDVVLVTETWLSPNILDEIVALPGYTFLRKDRTGRGGGVGVYVRQNLKVEILNFNIQVSDSFEFLVVKIKLPSRNLAIAVIYRPPNTNVNNFVNDIDNILSLTYSEFDDLIFMGDFNINFFNLQNPILHCFESYGFVQILNEPTRITNRTSTLIDPILVSNSESVTSSGTLSCEEISDHHLVYANFKFNFFKPRPKIVSYRCFKNFILNDFLVDLQNLEFYKIVTEKNIDNKILIFNNLLLTIFDRHAPFKESKVTKPKARWLNDDIRRLKKLRGKALSAYKRTRSEENWNEYKRLRNQTLSMIRLAKKTHLQQVCTENNPRKTWTTLRDLNIRSNKINSIPGELSNPEDINQYFSPFFQNVSNLCDDKITFYNNNIFNINNNFSFSLTTVEEIHNILYNVHSEAFGIDNISSKMLKLSSPYVDIYILHIINCCIEQNYFPTLWKTAVGKPLPKNNSPQGFSDIRIVSILPAISKIFEKVLYNQIFNYFIEKNILSDKQCGFRKGFSTATALVTMLHDIMTAWDEGSVTALVLLDFSKAFDTIDHRLLCSKLKYYGFDSCAIGLMSSYLRDRSQKIVVNGISSGTASILSGVPQGSILGPLLFIIYTTDILNSVRKCGVVAYADDTQLYYPFRISSVNEAELVLNNELECIRKLSVQHNLMLNSNKSTLMCFGSSKNRNFIKERLNIKIDNVTLPFVNCAKNLGVFVDEDLRFVDHIKYVNKKAYSSLKLIFSNRDILNTKLKRTLCDSLVLSHFNYCDFIYGNSLYHRDTSKIQRVQNTCCRLIFSLRKYDRISHKITDCNWLNMEHRRMHHFGVFLHSLFTAPHSSSLLRAKFIPRSDIHDRNIRVVNRFTVPRHRTAMFQRSFLYNAVKLYNSLPDEFRLYNVNKFKYKYRSFLFSKQIRIIA